VVGQEMRGTMERLGDGRSGRGKMGTAVMEKES